MKKAILIFILTAFIGFGTTSCVTTRPPHKPHPGRVEKKPKKKKPKHHKPKKKDYPPRDYWY